MHLHPSADKAPHLHCRAFGPAQGLMAPPRCCRVPEECPAEIAALIKACLSPDPGARPSSTAIFRALQAQAAPPSALPLAPALSAAMLAASVSGASRQGSAELRTGIGLGVKGLAASERGSAEEGSAGWPARRGSNPGASPNPGATPSSRPASPVPSRALGCGSRVSPEASPPGLATPLRAGCGPGIGSGSGAAVELPSVGLGSEGMPSAPAPVTPARLPGEPRPALASPGPSGPDAPAGAQMPGLALPPAPGGRHAPASVAASSVAYPGPGEPGAALGSPEQPSPALSGARGPGGVPDAQGSGAEGPWPRSGGGGHAEEAADRGAGSSGRVGGSDGVAPGPGEFIGAGRGCGPTMPSSCRTGAAGPGPGADEEGPPVPPSYFSSTAGPGPGAGAGDVGPPVPRSSFSSPGAGPAASPGVAAAAHDDAPPVPRSYFTAAAGPGPEPSQGQGEAPVRSYAATALADDAPLVRSPFAEYATGSGLGVHAMEPNQRTHGGAASGEARSGGYEAVSSPEMSGNEADSVGWVPGGAAVAQPGALSTVPETSDRAPMWRAYSGSDPVPLPPAQRDSTAETLPTLRAPLAASIQGGAGPAAGAKTPENLAGVPAAGMQRHAAVPLATVQTACSGCGDAGESCAASADGGGAACAVTTKAAPKVAADAPKAGLAGSLQRLFRRPATA